MAAATISLTRGAERDLAEICDYVARRDSPRRADGVLRQIGAAIERLALFPDRGSFPKELLALGIREYRQVFFKPYRIIYHVAGAAVTVVVIVDGRRDMESLLARRLLSP